MMATKRHIHAPAIAVLATGYVASLLAYPYLPGPFLDVSPSARILVAFTLPTTALVIYTLFRSLWKHDRVRGESEATHRQLVAAIEGMTDQEWTSRRPFEGDDAHEDLGTELGDVLGAPDRPFGHAFAHLPDLEAYARSVASR